MLKRILPILILLIILTCSDAYAEDISNGAQLNENEILWDVSDGTLTITGTGPIPNGYSPWLFSDEQYVGNDIRITRLVVSEGITRIGDYVTQGLSELESVSLPSTLRQIGGQNFHGMSNLSEIAFPDGLEEIDYCCFHNCDSLVSVTIPASLTDVGWGTFAFCASLDNIYVDRIV